MRGGTLSGMWKLLVLLVVCSLCAAGQTPVNTITVTAYRNSTAAPDLVAFTVAVDAPISMTRDDVIAALQGSGIGLANFQSVYSTFTYTADNQQVQQLEWSFSVTTPLAALKDGIASLAALKQSLAKSGLTLSFMIQGTQTSAAAAQAHPCSQAGLLADARAQAQSIAALATMRVLAVVSMATSVADVTPGNCSLSVKFALGPAI